MVASKPVRNRKKAGLGCGFTAMVGLTSIALLIINRLILDSLIGDVNEEETRIIDPLIFVLSVVMIFAQYWIYDRVTTRWTARPPK